MFKITPAVLLALAGSANAFWRMECPGRLDVARIDPIVNHNDVSAHAHSLHGSSGLSASADGAALKAGDCTSCRVTQDKSAYWSPSLYFEDKDTGKFELVTQVGGMLAYYLLYGDNITAFPDDFRMIAGSNTRRAYTAGNPEQADPDKSLWKSMGQTKQSILEQRALGFNCLNYDKQPEGTLYRHYMPDKAYLDANCKDGIRLEIMFPSCWDGKNTDAADHKSHMAYPDLVMTGTCPDGFQTRVPSLMFETIWSVAPFKGRNGRFVFSNGDTEGYAYHADFMMGWDRDFLQQAVQTCTNPSGRIEDCPLFNVVDQGTATSCKLQKSLPEKLAAEIKDILGPMASLPGGLSIFGDHGKPSLPETGSSAPSSTASKPTLSYTPGDKPTNSASPLPGQVFKQVDSESGSAATPAPTTAPAPVPASAAVTGAPSATPEPSFYSTQYITNGNTVSKILWQEEIVTVTETAEPTATKTVDAAQRRRSHLHGHARRS
ncbi:WSC domain-containing protein [Cordyceps fumosorosea ARSEF 2679]|uniref:WSC domain-containing protein n=1 Tax=Cordyceps fumosorosea (strain ARSEF 2679) TaxID=1081104 RepID=A0A168CK71_CORFA|nr:WSC domain-containing protein [Cordyceps fumosorosea ARSEF 2679]OAA71478.1 WSC domain-containing protein [Cordyceps fumosorosea ARSEF 2679]